MLNVLRVFLLAFILIASSSPTHAHSNRGRDVTWTQIDKAVNYNWELELKDPVTNEMVFFDLMDFGLTTTLTITTSCEKVPDETRPVTSPQEEQEEVKKIIIRSGRPDIVITGCSRLQIIPDYSREQLQRLKIHLMEHTRDPRVWRQLSRLHWWHGSY